MKVAIVEGRFDNVVNDAGPGLRPAGQLHTPTIAVFRDGDVARAHIVAPVASMTLATWLQANCISGEVRTDQAP